jgi:hypothetical protein
MLPGLLVGPEVAPIAANQVITFRMLGIDWGTEVTYRVPDSNQRLILAGLSPGTSEMSGSELSAGWFKIGSQTLTQSGHSYMSIIPSALSRAPLFEM